jgi:hypothetical protein
MKIRSKAHEAWEQAQRKTTESQERQQLKEDEANEEWLTETFDGATIEQFGAQGIDIHFSRQGYRRYLHIRGDCPRCGERAWSVSIDTWVTLGEMLNGKFRTDYRLHRCKRPATECADPVDTLRDVLLEILELE